MQLQTFAVAKRPVHVPLFPDRCLEKSDISSIHLENIFIRSAYVPPKPEPFVLPLICFFGTVINAVIGYQYVNSTSTLIIGGISCGLLILNAGVILDYLFNSSKRTQAWEEKRDLRITYENMYKNNEQITDIFCSLMLRIHPGSAPCREYDHLYSLLSLHQIVKGLSVAVIAETKAGTRSNFGESLRTTILKWNLAKFEPSIRAVFKFIIEFEKQRRTIYPQVPITQLISSPTIKGRFVQSRLMLEATIVHFASEMTVYQRNEMRNYSYRLENRTNEIFAENYFKAEFDKGVTFHVARDCLLVESPQYERAIKGTYPVLFDRVRAPEFIQLLSGEPYTPATLNLTKRLGLTSRLNLALTNIVLNYKFSIEDLQIYLFEQFTSRSENIAALWFRDLFQLHYSYYPKSSRFEDCVAFCRHVGLPDIPVLIAKKLVDELRNEYQRLNRPQDLLHVHRVCKIAGLKTSLYADFINSYIGIYQIEPDKTASIQNYWEALCNIQPGARFNEKDDFLAYCKTPEGRAKLAEAYLIGLPADLEAALDALPN